jgi:hypothetical protein
LRLRSTLSVTLETYGFVSRERTVITKRLSYRAVRSSAPDIEHGYRTHKEGPHEQQ